MITYTGVPFGVAINYSISSLSAHYFGWEWIFYVSGLDNNHITKSVVANQWAELCIFCVLLICNL